MTTQGRQLGALVSQGTTETLSAVIAALVTLGTLDGSIDVEADSVTVVEGSSYRVMFADGGC